MQYKVGNTLLTVVAALALASAALAQGNGGPPPGQRFPGGGGGMRRMPPPMGTVSAVDATAGTITITPQFGGAAPIVIHVSSDTQIVTEMTVPVSALRANDQVQVQGVPTGISASSIVDGQLPSFFPGRGGPGRGGFGGPSPGGPGGPPPPGAPGTPPTSQAMATGRIFSTNPLTVSLGNGVMVTLTLKVDTKVTKVMPLPLSGLKVGDRIMASGQPDANGVFNATAVGVNVDMGNMGGFGRRGFGGGFGGPGGQGGFGQGRRGGGRNRGGQGQFGGPAPPPPAPDNGA